MQNLWVRLNAVVFFALTVLLCLATMCAFSTLLHKGVPDVKELRISEVQSLQPYGGVDRALFKFNLKADFRPAFHWNLKQLFVFVVAEYESPNKPINQVIVWDKIIKSQAEANLIKNGEQCKYQLASQGAELRNKTVTLRLMWGTSKAQAITRRAARMPALRAVVCTDCPPPLPPPVRTFLLALLARCTTDHMPVTGRLYGGESEKHSHTLPGQYFKEQKGAAKASKRHA